MFENSSSASGRSGQSFGVSFALHVLGVSGLVLLGTVPRSPLDITETYRSVTIFAPASPPSDDWNAPARRRQPVKPPKRARVTQPRDKVAPARKALAADRPKVRIEPVAAPVPAMAVRTPLPPPAVPRPTPPAVETVKTGLLATARAAEIPITPSEKVQAAGFGQASAFQQEKSSLSVPAGPSPFGQVAADDGARWRNARYERPTEGAAGFGQARAGAEWTAGAKIKAPGSGATGSGVTGFGAAGFEEVKAGSVTGNNGPAQGGPAKQAGFEEVVYTDDAKTPSLPQHPSHPSRSVRIVAKPRPEYTAEARDRRIEGEVQLEVLFAASGEIEVLSIVRGLGYGLDENAIEAARAIQFEPALRNGKPADLVATVHIRFQLAY